MDIFFWSRGKLHLLVHSFSATFIFIMLLTHILYIFDLLIIHMRKRTLARKRRRRNYWVHSITSARMTCGSYSSLYMDLCGHLSSSSCATGEPRLSMADPATKVLKVCFLTFVSASLRLDSLVDKVCAKHAHLGSWRVQVQCGKLSN